MTPQLAFRLLYDFTYAVSLRACDAVDIEIPALHAGKSVTAIEGFGFSQNTRLRSVTLPDTVQEIGTFAFEGCTALTTVTLPRHLKKIGRAAFHGCTALRALSVPAGCQIEVDAIPNHCKIHVV